MATNKTTNKMLGTTFGRLTVVAATDRREDNCVVWECLCSCGKTHYVPTRRLTQGTTRSCGCLRNEGRPVEKDHNNRDCREAVLLALYLAELTGRPQYIWYGHTTRRYAVKGHAHPPGRPVRRGEKTRRSANVQNAYRVTPDGGVTPGRGFPARGELFDPAEGWLYLESRLRSDPGGRWARARDRGCFRPSQRWQAEALARELNGRNTGFEYRVEG